MAALSLYCDETGGDYFDFLEFCQDDAIQADIVVGDVTGHGVSAALFMLSSKNLTLPQIEPDAPSELDDQALIEALNTHHG